jgi:hypothetical protein
MAFLIATGSTDHDNVLLSMVSLPQTALVQENNEDK